MHLIDRLPIIGTAAQPLRPSSLDKIVKCGVWYVMLLEADDTSGAAAQNGSLTHAAVAAFHLAPAGADRIKAAFDAIASNANKFPLAEANEVKLNLTPYIADPRNANAKFATIPAREYTGYDDAGKPLPGRVGEPAIEVPVRLILPPHPLDLTGQDIYIQGTLDQIREENGKQPIADLKTGQPAGKAMIHDYAFQIAAYTLAARQSGFPGVTPGYLIRSYSYRQRGAQLPSPQGVYWHMPFDVAGAEYLMERVRLQVALIRNGQVDFGPGHWCTYCVMGGLDGCIPIANKRLFSLPMA